MFKPILSVFMFLSLLFVNNVAQASPDQQERIQFCQREAMLTQIGFQARLQMDMEEFMKRLQEFKKDMDKDPDISKEDKDHAVKSLLQGFSGLSPQKAFNACMSQKQVKN